jgi:precorrin-2 dehydrogenase / sirohydrochlorin ferrochelatase
MLPLVLDLSRLKTILIGDGAAALRRLDLLDAAGAADLAVYAENPSAALMLAAGHRLVRRLPTTRELAAARLVFISDRTLPQCRALAAAARAAGALVHVEDETSLSDVHAPAVLRRGDLTIAVSTGGKSPGLAVQVKRFLATILGQEWRDRLDTLAALRQAWRTRGADSETVTRWTEALIDNQGWLPTQSVPATAAERPASAGDANRRH